MRRGSFRTASLGVGLVLSATFALTGSPAAALATSPVTSPAAAATVTVSLSSHGIGTLPANYLGLSFESSTSVNTSDFDTKGDLARLLEDLGPGVLRFGGITVDQSYTGATKSALKRLTRLAKATGWSVIYTVDLGKFSASAVTNDARAVAAALGRSLNSIACGNEPDGYTKHGIRRSGYNESRYLTEAAACMKAVHKGAPKAEISGPDTYHPSWLPPYAAAEKGKISLLTEHFYPLTNCSKHNRTAAALLSRQTARTEATTISTAAASARADGVPLRITETNSASCSGITGLSNTYAAALWAVDYLLTGAEHGASGMNFHGNLSKKCDGYTPLCEVERREYIPQPVFYGMLFTHLLGPGKLLPVKIRSSLDLAGHAVRASNGTVRVVIENLSDSAAVMTLNAGTVAGIASTENLTGPSLSATSGVEIQGASVQSDGTFTPGTAAHLTCTVGQCPVTMAADSAIIITLPGKPR
jgi:hypothetical protein